MPFLLHLIFGTPSLAHASQISILLAATLVFVSGYVLGRVAGQSPLRQGLRMTIAAVATFLLLILIQVYVI
jgi:VIT1/CCC1 family predicted Fe2+/Mn2+ transporter